MRFWLRHVIFSSRGAMAVFHQFWPNQRHVEAFCNSGRRSPKHRGHRFLLDELLLQVFSSLFFLPLSVLPEDESKVIRGFRIRSTAIAKSVAPELHCYRFEFFKFSGDHPSSSSLANSSSSISSLAPDLQAENDFGDGFCICWGAPVGS